MRWLGVEQTELPGPLEGGKKLELMAYFYHMAQISIFQELVGETGREIKDIFLFSSLGTAAGKTYSVSYFQRLGRRMVFKRTHKHSQNIHSEILTFFSGSLLVRKGPGRITAIF